MIKTTLFINGLPVVYTVEPGAAIFSFVPEDEIWQCVYPSFAVKKIDGNWNFDEVNPSELKDQVAEEISSLENYQQQRSNP